MVGKQHLGIHMPLHYTIIITVRKIGLQRRP
jgi:hypothetical protein